MVELADAVFLFNYLFLQGDIPPTPGPDGCGPEDTLADELDCASYLPCEG